MTEEKCHRTNRPALIRKHCTTMRFEIERCRSSSTILTRFSTEIADARDDASDRYDRLSSFIVNPRLQRISVTAINWEGSSQFLTHVVYLQAFFKAVFRVSFPTLHLLCVRISSIYRHHVFVRLRQEGQQWRNLRFLLQGGVLRNRGADLQPRELCTHLGCQQGSWS